MTHINNTGTGHNCHDQLLQLRLASNKKAFAVIVRKIYFFCFI